MSTALDVVRAFLEVVRSGAAPDRATDFMAPVVQAHQLQGEAPETVERTPQQYADHVRDMLAEHGRFSLSVDELFASDDKVYARWTQVGSPETGAIVQLTSCVYRVDDSRIVEYWIQIDRYGIEAQQR